MESNEEMEFLAEGDDDDLLIQAEEMQEQQGSIEDNDLDGINFDEEMEAETVNAADISIGANTDADYLAEGSDFLDGFDAESGKRWIYPTNYPIRDYQYNIVQQALLKNTMVVLPTGLGKTFIAAVVMYNLYRWFPEGKIIFMAPTKPLVAQQIHACYNIMGIPKADTVEMTGTMPPAVRQRAWREKRVVYLTPQVLTNDLSRGSIDGAAVRCLVIDEAHKALGNHAYCQVVRELVKFTQHFRVLALSATPGSDLRAVQQVMDNLLISHIELRSEDSLDIRPYTHERKVEKIVVPLGEELAAIRLQYMQIMTMVVQRLTRYRVLYNREITKLSKFLILKSRDEFRQNPPPNLQPSMYGTIEGDFALAMSLYHGFELLQLHGLRSLYNFMMGIVTGEKAIGRTKTELMRNADFREIMEKLRDKFDQGAKPGDTKKVVVGHPKMQRLEEIVVDHFKTFQIRGQETRVMIFSQYRDSVQEISAILSQHHPLVKVMPFIGQSSDGKTSRGYTQKEQLKVMKEFREGGYNTLVATCVGEEGLDIGDVDLIICFDAHKSPIRLVQRMGRTGRKRAGRIVMLVTQGKEEQIYNSSLSSKKSIHKAILNGARTLRFYPNNHRLVPASITPQCFKMHITVATSKPASQSGAKKKTRKISFGNQSISDMFGKQAKTPKETGFLTPREFAEIQEEFSQVSQLAKHLPKPKCVMLSSAEERQEEHSDKIINLAEWMPWQNTLQDSHLCGHSSRTHHLVKDAEFLQIQELLGEGEDNYGAEMRMFVKSCDLDEGTGHVSFDAQSSIRSFLVPAENNGETEDGPTVTDEEDNQSNDGGHVDQPGPSRLFTELKGKSAESTSRKKNVKKKVHKGNEKSGKAVKKGKKSSVLRKRSKDVSEEEMSERERRRSKLLQSLIPSQGVSSDKDDFEGEEPVEKQATPTKSISITTATEGDVIVERMADGSPSSQNTTATADVESEVNKNKTGDKTTKDERDKGKDETTFTVMDVDLDLIPSTPRISVSSIKSKSGIHTSFENLNASICDKKKRMGSQRAQKKKVPPAPPIGEVKGLIESLHSGPGFGDITLDDLTVLWIRSDIEDYEKENVPDNALTEYDQTTKNMDTFTSSSALGVKRSDLFVNHSDPNISFESAFLNKVRNNCKKINCESVSEDSSEKDQVDMQASRHEDIPLQVRNDSHDDSLLVEGWTSHLEASISPTFKNLTGKPEKASSHGKGRKSVKFSESVGQIPSPTLRREPMPGSIVERPELGMDKDLFTLSDEELPEDIFDENWENCVEKSVQKGKNAIKSNESVGNFDIVECDSQDKAEHNISMNQSMEKRKISFKTDSSPSHAGSGELRREKKGLKVSIEHSPSNLSLSGKSATGRKSLNMSNSFITFSQALNCLGTSSTDNTPENNKEIVLNVSSKGDDSLLKDRHTDVDNASLSRLNLLTNERNSSHPYVRSDGRDSTHNCGAVVASQSRHKARTDKCDSPQEQVSQEEICLGLTQALDLPSQSPVKSKSGKIKSSPFSKHEVCSLSNKKSDGDRGRTSPIIKESHSMIEDKEKYEEKGREQLNVNKIEQVEAREHVSDEDLPQFDLGFDFDDDDIIMSTPPKFPPSLSLKAGSKSSTTLVHTSTPPRKDSSSDRQQVSDKKEFKINTSSNADILPGQNSEKKEAKVNSSFKSKMSANQHSEEEDDNNDFFEDSFDVGQVPFILASGADNPKTPQINQKSGKTGKDSKHKVKPGLSESEEKENQDMMENLSQISGFLNTFVVDKTGDRDEESQQEIHFADEVSPVLSSSVAAKKTQNTAKSKQKVLSDFATSQRKENSKMPKEISTNSTEVNTEAQQNPVTDAMIISDESDFAPSPPKKPKVSIRKQDLRTSCGSNSKENSSDSTDFENKQLLALRDSISKTTNIENDVSFKSDNNGISKKNSNLSDANRVNEDFSVHNKSRLNTGDSSPVSQRQTSKPRNLSSVINLMSLMPSDEDDDEDSFEENRIPFNTLGGRSPSPVMRLTPSSSLSQAHSPDSGCRKSSKSSSKRQSKVSSKRPSLLTDENLTNTDFDKRQATFRESQEKSPSPVKHASLSKLVNHFDSEEEEEHGVWLCAKMSTSKQGDKVSSFSHQHLKQRGPVTSSTPLRPAPKGKLRSRLDSLHAGKELTLTPIKDVQEEEDGDNSEHDSEDSFLAKRIKRKKKAPVIDSFSQRDKNESSLTEDSSKEENKDRKKDVSPSVGANFSSVCLDVDLEDADDDDDFEDVHFAGEKQPKTLKLTNFVPPAPKAKKGKVAGYIEVEAEESGDNASSDEHEGGDDFYEASFIDNNTMLTQTQHTDMHAVYLKSVKSPPPGGPVGKGYKFSTRVRGPAYEVFSQTIPEDYGESEYEEDSFVVGSDEVIEEEEDSELYHKPRKSKDKKKSKETKTKPKVQEGRRRIKLLSESEEEEGEEERIMPTQEFNTAATKAKTLKGRRMLDSSDEFVDDEECIVQLGGDEQETSENKITDLASHSVSSDALKRKRLRDDEGEKFENSSRKSSDGTLKNKDSRLQRKGIISEDISKADGSKGGNKRQRGMEFGDEESDEDFEDTSLTKIKSSKIDNEMTDHSPNRKNIIKSKAQKVKASEGSSPIQIGRNADTVKKLNDSSLKIKETSKNKTQTGNKNEMADFSLFDEDDWLGDEDFEMLVSNWPVKEKSPQKSATKICDKSPGSSRGLNTSPKQQPSKKTDSPGASLKKEKTSPNTETSEKPVKKDNSNPSPEKPTFALSKAERLKKQKEKQEMFRLRHKLLKSQAETSPTAQSSSGNSTIKPDKMATAQTGSSRSVDWGDESTASAWEGSGSKQNMVTSPVFSSPSTSASVSRDFTNLMTPHKSQDKPLILVDSKEISSAQSIISSLRWTHGYRVTARHLPGCNYIVSNVLAVNRMHWSVFSKSKERAKLASLLNELQALYEECAFIVETDKPKPGQEKQKKPNQHTKYVESTIAYVKKRNISLHFTENCDETAKQLAELCEEEATKGRTLHVPSSFSESKEELFNALSGIPNLTVPQALNLAYRFRSIEEIVASSVGVIQDRGLMTSQKAQALLNFLRDHYSNGKSPKPFKNR